MLFRDLCVFGVLRMVVAAPQCQENSIIELGDHLYYQNNVFLASHCADGWWSCIDYAAPYTMVNYTCWPKSGPDGDDDTIKSLPYIVAGWNTGIGYKYGAGAGGLPFPARGFEGQVLTSLSSSHINGHEQPPPSWEMWTLSYTIWLSNVANLPANGVPDLELFIYLHGNKTFEHSPVGGEVGTGTACGASWDIYKGQGPPRQTEGNSSAGSPDNSWLTWSWKLQALSYSIHDCDLTEVLKGMEVQFPGVLPKYVIGIHAGEQMFQGEGSFANMYSLKVTNESTHVGAILA